MLPVGAAVGCWMLGVAVVLATIQLFRRPWTLMSTKEAAILNTRDPVSRYGTHSTQCMDPAHCGAADWGFVCALLVCSVVGSGTLRALCMCWPSFSGGPRRS
jgi:hypothetical protein